MDDPETALMEMYENQAPFEVNLKSLFEQLQNHKISEKPKAMSFRRRIYPRPSLQSNTTYYYQANISARQPAEISQIDDLGIDKTLQQEIVKRVQKRFENSKSALQPSLPLNRNQQISNKLMINHFEKAKELKQSYSMLHRPPATQRFHHSSMELRDFRYDTRRPGEWCLSPNKRKKSLAPYTSVQWRHERQPSRDRDRQTANQQAYTAMRSTQRSGLVKIENLVIESQRRKEILSSRRSRAPLSGYDSQAKRASIQRTFPRFSNLAD